MGQRKTDWRQTFLPLPMFWLQQVLGGRLCLMWKSLLAPQLSHQEANLVEVLA